MDQTYKVDSLKDLEEKSAVFKYRFIKKNYKDLYRIFAENSNKKEFRQSRNAAFILIFLPGFVNLYYAFINPSSMFKNPLRIGAVFGCFIHFTRQVYADMISVGKTDTPVGNRIKKMWQNIAFYEGGAPDFGEETLQTWRERVEVDSRSKG